MDREAIQRLVNQAYAARSRGQVEELMEAFGSDATFELFGDKRTLPITCTISGHQNIKQALKQFSTDFEFLEREITSFLVDGDRAAVHSRLKIRFVPKDRTFTTELVDLFRFENGKVAELVEFTDTAQLKEIISA
ncbi:nuclear transport factor 2 family protein [Bradyrhizobium jicamae]|uniref:Nuclear transport factor 2 family protein n=1 Tax=Bradyrhizobium jicamae TaxID=280332 RepID=A0ABS5FBQ5_9BRAD|nr:nuclear transport factor 2 family protein [Bradyrhizobium jicamae]MBR0794213.1 nuclear transport factor 2 family protein [Bradyrhizobium jicamae]MBR0935826.1 nuclear transport factor 2 family protein [Bradyrhizobium jicamae]